MPPRERKRIRGVNDYLRICRRVENVIPWAAAVYQAEVLQT